MIAGLCAKQIAIRCTMKLNSKTKIIGRNVVLVPYRKLHVPKYHEWMKSVELQQLTASEPLSLDEEYQMQEKWLLDEDKCTFIILEKAIFNETDDEIEAMIGDTNLFLQMSEPSLRVAEAEIMVAEHSARRKRYGWEAILLMLRYGCDELCIQKYVVKIGMDNNKSISMFIKIGFEEMGRSAIFQEVTLEKTVTQHWKLWLEQETEESRVEKEA